MEINRTSEELEQLLGARLRELRILRNLDQVSLAERSGVSLNALKHLESGKGARVNSLIKVLRGLERADWLETLAPAVSISPMQMLKRDRREPKRARRRLRVRA
ncbi:MAG TPA: helix-turn-helix transcriptional regulator [Steroidobacteraceae bacterium]|nr:helix-turn-helix transcriptional regulator [Steroidobacteraceae bacterium]